MADLRTKDEMAPGAVAEGGTMDALHTGSWRTYVPQVDLEKCTNCLICWILCPDTAIPVRGAERGETNLQHCKGCGICATECPADAIEMHREGESRDDQ